jgi:ABC-type transport system involved in multi-copper enzyme maturation permease subunit
MKVFLALLRKDWRLVRVPFYGLAAMTAMGYLVSGAAFLWNKHDAASKGVHYSPSFFTDYLPAGAGIGMFLTTLLAAAFGGAAFAQERREHWADFLANMPVKRWRIVVSKLSVALACLLLFWAFNGAVEAVCLAHGWGESPGIGVPQPQLISKNVFVVLVGAGAFGLAWLFSTFLKSDAIATCMALAAEAVACGMFFTLSYLTRGSELADHTLAIAFVAVPAITIIAGSIYYARRVAP